MDAEGQDLSDGMSSPSRTRYDHLMAAPSDRELRIMWISWSALAGVVAIFVGFVLLAVLSSQKARNRSFNLYLVFLTLPDIFFSAACAVTCALNAAAGYYLSDWMCSFQAFYCAFAFTANAWLNAITVRQVHVMLQHSHRRQRYKPPMKKRVIVHAVAVYAYSAVLASLSLFNTSVHRHSPVNGLACLPIDFSTRSTLFFWLVYFWLWIGLPIVYVLYVWVDVRRRKLLPKSGRTRSVAIFFARITFVFLLMWLPTVIAIYIIGASSAWFSFLGGAWSHLQPAVSIGVSLLKGDIREAFLDFVKCRSFTQNTAVEDPNAPWEEPPTRKRRSSNVFASFLANSLGRRASQDTNRRHSSDGCNAEILPSPIIAPNEGFVSEATRTTATTHSHLEISLVAERSRADTDESLLAELESRLEMEQVESSASQQKAKGFDLCSRITEAADGEEESSSNNSRSSSGRFKK